MRAVSDVPARGTTYASTAPMARTALVAGTLYGLAMLVHLVVRAVVSFPLHEGSAYYVAVARNLASGQGLVIDAIWSYATPPLTLPRPAFELWQPLASLIAALPMPTLGATFQSAQLAFALLGALTAPLAWAVASDAARRLQLNSRRVAAVSVGSGLLAAVFGPFLLATAAPDSTLPFLVFAALACLLMPRSLSGGWRSALALGAVLGLAYLVRMEAVYLGLVYVVLALSRRRLASLPPVIVGGLLVAVPWLVRNVVTFGSPFPGQAIDNALLTRNEEIFAYSQPPTLAAFLEQGVDGIATNIGRALVHGLLDVLLVPGGVLIAAGLAWALWRAWRPELRGSPLAALLLTGLFTYVGTSVLFPVATLWGTFAHASGPLLLGLLVSGALAADAFVAHLRKARGWQRSNAWLAPFSLLVLTVPLAGLQLWLASAQADAQRARLDALVQALPDLPPGPLISDHPVWLSEVAGRPALVLPDEPPASVLSLARDFGAAAVVLTDSRGRYPAVLRDPDAAECFAEVPLAGGAPAGSALFRLVEGCQP